MNTQNSNSLLQSVEDWLHKGIRLWLAQGNRLTAGVFALGPGCRCAIGACLPHIRQGCGNLDFYYEMKRIFPGIKFSMLDSFIRGFDGDLVVPQDQWYDLGRRIYDEYLGT